MKEYWNRAYCELAENKEFLEMKLALVTTLNDWNVYEILVE